MKSSAKLVEPDIGATARGLELYRSMLRIRLFERRAESEYAAGNISGALHLSIGQEAIAAGVCAAMAPDDILTTTHRGHGHCLARGMSPAGMAAELLGRTTGVCAGKGGSMHMADVARGVLGANGIVGGGIPLACGAALASVYQQSDRVAVAFFGDGAANIGAFSESLNLAAVFELPVVFVAENNGYAEATPFEAHCAGGSIARRADGYGIPGITVDGLDVIEVLRVGEDAIAQARAGRGPYLIEAIGHRVAGHHEGDTQTYRLPGERERMEANDPLDRIKLRLSAEAHEEIARIESEEAAVIDQAWQEAHSAPFPPEAELTTDVYVNYGRVA